MIHGLDCPSEDAHKYTAAIVLPAETLVPLTLFGWGVQEARRHVIEEDIREFHETCDRLLAQIENGDPTGTLPTYRKMAAATLERHAHLQPFAEALRAVDHAAQLRGLLQW